MAHMDEELIENHKYLSFILNDENYAIPLSHVKQIQSFQSLTHINTMGQAPLFLKGVIHFNDAVIPLLDMRLFFGITENVLNDYRVVIFIHDEQKIFGMIVDAVSDIIQLTSPEIKPAPDFFAIRYHGCVENIGVLNEQMYILLDVNKIIMNEKLELTKYLELAEG